MELLLIRIARKDRYTIGRLYVIENGLRKYLCDTLENADRLFFGKPKMKGITAIPCGRYEIVQNIRSPRFGNNPFYKNLCDGYLPRFKNVPMFDGVLFHAGNDENDTDGCVLVGENRVVGKVLDSRKTLTALMQGYFIPAKKRGERVFITVK